MAWAIITIYTSKCSQMDPQQLSKPSKVYSRCKKCDIEKVIVDGYHHPLGSLKAKRLRISYFRRPRKVIGQNGIGQNGTVKMVRSKWYRQNGSNFYRFQFN